MIKPVTDVRAMADALVNALARITGPDDDVAVIETFCAIALRVISKTHPTKVREEARLVDIQSRIPPGVTKQ